MQELSKYSAAVVMNGKSELFLWQNASSNKNNSISESTRLPLIQLSTSQPLISQKEQQGSLKYLYLKFPPVASPPVSSPQTSINFWHLFDPFTTSQIDLASLFYFWASM